MQDLLRFIESRPQSLFKDYMGVVSSNPAYFTDVNFPDLPEGQRRQNDFISSLLDDVRPSPPVDRATLDYLTRVAGLTRREIRLAGWASYSGLHDRRFLFAPARRPAGIIGVRALRIQTDPLGFQGSEFRYDLSDRLFEPNPNTLLAVPDAPVPFSRGCFDQPDVWVSNDPVDALVLKSLGVNATSLARPFETLASKEGLWQLQDLGAITPRARPKGTLVIVDDAQRITREQAGLLQGQFETVWVSTNGVQGQVMWDMARASRASNGYGRDLFVSLTEFVAGTGGTVLLQGDPEPLPRRVVWSSAGASSRPPAFKPVSELAGPEQSDIEWLVEGFIAPEMITQFLGGPKSGKSTLLLSMLAEVSRGGMFLGKRCRKAPVLYVTEQTSRSFAQSLKRSLPSGTTADDLPDLRTLTTADLEGISWPDTLAHIRTSAQETGARIVVFDTLSEVARVHGDAENSAGASRTLYNSMRPLLSDGIAVVAVRHTNKYGRGGIVESGLGSVANAGSADHLVRVREVKKRKTIRRIDTLGRPSDAEDFLIQKTPSGWVRLNGGVSEVERDEPDMGLRGLVLDALKKGETEGLRHSALTEALRVSAPEAGRKVPGRTTLDQVLKGLVAEGHVAEERMQSTGRPKLFLFVSDPPP